jgi:C4-dicarboxylate-specific signal transduction histidine kinase
MAYPEFRKDIFKLLENIEHGSKRISTFVSNLREYSLGKNENPIKEADLTNVLEKVLLICQSNLKKSVKSLVKKVPEDLPTIYTDPYALEQVLINLLLNAAQAADKEDSWIKLDVKIKDDRQDHTIIAVSDNGCGMDEKTRLSVFDPFFTTKPPAEGTGLGLYVTHNLIRDLGGRIEVQSEPGKGSKFIIILPDMKR